MEDRGERAPSPQGMTQRRGGQGDGGEVRDGEVAFDRFAIGLEQFAEAPALGGRVSFSLRPQSIRLLRQRPPASSGSAAIPGPVVQRAYLGEHWDYVVRPAARGLPP